MVAGLPLPVTFRPSWPAYRRWLTTRGVAGGVVVLPLVLIHWLALVLALLVVPVVVAFLALTFRRSHVTVSDRDVHWQATLHRWRAPIGSLQAALFTFTTPPGTMWTGNTEATLRVHDAKSGKRRATLHVGIWDAETLNELGNLLQAPVIVTGADDLRRGGSDIRDFHSARQAMLFRQLNDHFVWFVLRLILGTFLVAVVGIGLLIWWDQTR